MRNPTSWARKLAVVAVLALTSILPNATALLSQEDGIPVLTPAPEVRDETPAEGTPPVAIPAGPVLAHAVVTRSFVPGEGSGDPDLPLAGAHLVITRSAILDAPLTSVTFERLDGEAEPPAEVGEGPMFWIAASGAGEDPGPGVIVVRRILVSDTQAKGEHVWTYHVAAPGSDAPTLTPTTRQAPDPAAA